MDNNKTICSFRGHDPSRNPSRNPLDNLADFTKAFEYLLSTLKLIALKRKERKEMKEKRKKKQGIYSTK